MKTPQQSRTLFFRWLIPKVFIIVTYTSLLALFLYSPRIIDYFEYGKESLNIYAFTEFISTESLEKFSRETGIQVSIKYFEANEDLHTKMRITGGEGYDLITPSDFMVELLKNDGLLHPLDKKLLTNLPELDRRLLGKYYDPNNDFSVPIAWMPYGIALDKHILTNMRGAPSLNLLFQPPGKLFDSPGVTSKNHRICMPDDIREMVYLAALYLFGRVTDLHDEELAAIKQLLIKQRAWVESYSSDSGLLYLLIGNIVPLAYGSSIFIQSLLGYTDQFSFIIPREGSLLTIENMAIPIQCKKTALVHKLINFLISEEIAHFNSSLYGYNPTNKEVYKRINKKNHTNQHLFLSDEVFAKLYLIRNDLPVDKLEALWLAVKSS